MPVEGAADTALSFDIADGTQGSLGETRGGTEGGGDDVLGGKRTFYPSGQLCSYFKKDGSGIVHYPDGRIAVNVVAGDGIPPGLFTTFFRRKGKKDVLGSWNAVGIGSCNYDKGGKTCVNTTEAGGSFYDEYGDLIRMWTWDKKPLLEPIEIDVNDCIHLQVVSRKEINMTFKSGDNKLSFQLGFIMRRSDSYLDKITGVGKGDERGKFALDIDKCRAALAQTQVLRDSFKASKVNPTMPKEGELDKRVIEMANNPKKISTQAIRDAAFKIMTISSENAGSLHALSYIEHVIGDDGRRHPVAGPPPDETSTSFKLQQTLLKGWKCVQPREDVNSTPQRAPVLMGGRFETCTRFPVHFTKKVKLTAVKAKDYDAMLARAPKTQAVLVVCISAASPLASNKALAMCEDVNGMIWERFGGMSDLKTRECTKSVRDLPYRLCSFDMAESRLLAHRYNIKSVPMFLIYYNSRLVFANNTFTLEYNKRWTEAPHPVVERMCEAVNKACFGYTAEDAMRTLEEARGNGQKGKFLDDVKFECAKSSLADAKVLSTIKPFPSAGLANARKRPLLKAVKSEPTGVDGIGPRMNFVFGQSGKV